MSADAVSLAVSLIVSVGLLLYLVVALLKPEWFS